MAIHLTSMRQIYLALLSGIWACLAFSAFAQTPISPIVLPDNISVEAIDARAKTVSENPDIDAAAKKEISDIYANAKARLQTGKANLAKAERVSAQAANPESQIENLEAQLSEAKAKLAEPMVKDDSLVTDESLLRMEQSLTSLESEVETLREQRDTATREQALIATQKDSVREARTAAINSLEDIQTQIAALGDEEAAGLLEAARRTFLFARRYARQAELRALTAESQYLPVADKLGPLNIALFDAKIEALDLQIQSLREKTGQRRAQEASQRIEESLANQSLVAERHILLQYVAEQNLTYAQQIQLIAEAGGNTSVIEAGVNGLLQQVADDKALADQILAEGNIDRKYGAVLRRLRSNIPNSNSINSQIEARQKIKLDISMQSILAKDKLKQFTVGRLNIPVFYAAWFADNPEAPELSEEDEALLRELNETQRNLLGEIASNAGAKVSKLVSLNTAQQKLLDRIDDLRTLLDQRLVWLPSTEALSLSWPSQVVLGAGDVLRPENFVGAGKDFAASLPRHIWVTLLVIAAFLASWMARRKLVGRLKAMRNTVGRVQKDTLLNTPIAVVVSIIRVLPFCLLGLWAGYILFDSGGTDFSIRLGQAIIAISALYLALMTIREWSRDGGLFDLHLNVKKHLRLRIMRNLRWFTPAQSLAVLLMTLCEGHESERVTAGLGMFGFIVGTLSIAFFIYRLLWSPQAHVSRFVKDDSFIGRHRKSIFGALLALPIVTTILAVSGYFATALEVQSRFIFTVGLIIFAFVLYGVVRRTVVVSQRRLALEQAKARREQALKEREEREAAEERGEQAEQAVPGLNYDEIDLETISRQSTQLLNIIVVVLFGSLAWALWADLLPALSAFNDIELPISKLVSDADNVDTSVPVTLWDLIKAVFAGILTFLAARNLPGFLDLFVLKRSGVTAGSRYAITTVLGYAIMIIGVLVISELLGVEWSNLQWIIAALGVGIGFGLQEIIANFISGLIILFERPVRIGDYVTIGDQSGTVARIQIRATTLSDLDNREILIPNRELIAGRVTNWTLSNSTLRMVVKVGIAYGSDTEKAQKLMLSTVKKVKAVLDTPEPQVLFLGFGDSSLDFEIRIFLPSFTARFPVAHEIHTEVNKALEAAGISIPFPQRDLHIVSSTVDSFAPKPV